MADAVRTALLLRQCMEVLRESDEPVHGQEVLTRVGQRIALTAYEASTFGNGDQPRWENHLRWRTGEAATVGWLSKRDGLWNLTTAGETALDTYDPEQFLTELSRRYKEIRKQRQAAVKQLSGAENKIAQALSVVNEGNWTTFIDLAAHADVSAQKVPHFLASTNPALPGSHRVLNNDGTLPPNRLISATFRGTDLHRRLMTEGVEFDEDGHASPRQRLNADDITERLIDLGDKEETSVAVRAWLVRGSSVEGWDMVPSWLHDGYVSLAGTSLRAITPPIARDELTTIVENDYQHKSYAARETKVAEFDAFCNRMRPGDYLLTPTGGKTYLGRIASDATYVQSKDQRSNLRRDAEWFNAGQPVPFSNLPLPLPARLGGQADVVELTEDLAAIEKLLAGLDVTVDEPTPQPPRELAPPEIAEVEDSKVIVSREWLQEQANLLWHRRQMIFYGPPGTGKTILARELARRWADPSAVKLVQFHPSYTYEDFFEGFRPEQRDGQLVFKLQPGPFRKLVEDAEEHKSDPYILIIDEINRANLAKVFGELYFLLEYRDDSIGLLYSSEKDFTLPPNVFIIGTMNTTDRSIALVDAAMRRRFAFVELHPSQEPTASVLRTWLTSLADAGGLEHHADAADVLDALNLRIEDHDLAIGPSFLMRKEIYRDENGLNKVWESDILPLLAEHHYGSPPDILNRYRLDVLRKFLATKRSATEP
ncbi:MAG: AAA family ATPase [Actinomycetota bacterium]|nr:AAA family ATPase [Actinomycetota bacterium]